MSLSLADLATDLAQATSLLWGQEEDGGLEDHWHRRGRFGLVVLAMAWSPGVLAVVHMVAHRRPPHPTPRYFLELLLVLQPFQPPLALRCCYSTPWCPPSPTAACSGPGARAPPPPSSTSGGLPPLTDHQHPEIVDLKVCAILAQN